MPIRPSLLLLALLPLGAAELLPADLPAKPGVPSGWAVAKDWMRTFVSVVRPGDAAALQIRSDKPHDLMAQYELDVSPGDGPVVLRATITCRDPKPGSQTWERPQLVLLARTAEGREIRHVSERFDAMVENRQVELRLAVPADAAKLVVRAGFLRSQGTLLLSNLAVTR